MDCFSRLVRAIGFCCTFVAVQCSLPVTAVFAEVPAAREKQVKQLFAAIREGRKERVQQLIDEGVDVNSRDADKCTPLHCAASYKRAEILRLLIRAGADVNAYQDMDGSVLHLAVAYCPVDVVRDLLAAGADVNSDGSRTPLRFGQTPLHVAADRCNAEMVSVLLAAGATVDSGDMTPLTYACREAKGDQTAAVKLLLSAGASVNPPGDPPLHWVRSPAVAKLLIAAGADVNHRDKEGRTPLHLTHGGYWGPRESEFELMLAAGADVNARDRNQSTPLHQATTRNLPNVVRVLIEAGADINAVDTDGNTPLTIARLMKSEELTTMLRQAGADDGQTPLGRAAAEGNLERVQELLATGVAVDGRGPEKKTALHLACEHGHAEIVRALISAKADVNNHAVGEVTPIHLAANAEVAAALLEAGAQKRPEPVSQIGTPLFVAATNGRRAVVELLHGEKEPLVPRDLGIWATFYGHADVLDLLLQRGANPNEQLSVFGPSALLVATTGAIHDMSCTEQVTPATRLAMAHLLIEAGANVGVSSGFGYFEGFTALHAAAEKGEVEMVKLLLKHSADPDAQGASGPFAGITPLHLAVKHGHVDAVAALLKAGAEVNARSAKTETRVGQTPLDLAATGELRELLIEHGGKPAAELAE